MINAKPGDVIELGEGRFDFNSTLSLDVSHVTLRGKGPDKTILSFKNQGAGTGGEGLLVTSKDDVTVADLAIEDARGDGIKTNGTKRIVFRNVRTEWTGGPKETNGGYGIYPVLCTDVLIEGCKVSGASDAGIYVGQSTNIIVRRNTVEKNVAGIEIENCTKADVYENVATDNSGGILVFTMPDLPTKDGRMCRVFNNKVQGQQPRKLRSQGEHRRVGSAGHRRHDPGQRRGRGLRQHDREKPDRRPVDHQLSVHGAERSRTRSSTRSARRSTSTTTASRATAANRPGRSARC